MIVEGFAVGPFVENVYIVGDERTKEALVVDPGAEPERILAALDRHGLTARLIICTHNHIDHIGAVTAVRASTGALFAMSQVDYGDIGLQAQSFARFLGEPLEIAEPDRFLEEGDTIEIGDISLKVLSTPGHTRGHLSFAGEGILFSGDLLFAGSIGRFDLPGGDGHQLLRSIRDKVLPLPDETGVAPGHGRTTTVGQERATNRYVLALERLLAGELAF